MPLVRPLVHLARLACGAMCLCVATLDATAQVTLTDTGTAVDVAIDGAPFTTFHTGGEHLNRVHLHPLRAATGTVVNRSVPAGQLPGETVDHPHHAGLFYGHGDVNGYNFWAVQNVPTPPSAGDATRGRIVLDRPVTLTSGGASGSINAVLRWLTPAGGTLLTETRRMTFHADPVLRIIDVDIDLMARERVEFRDTKEGTFALRVATALDEPRPRARPGDGVRTGRLLNAQGAVGEANVWGKQSAWVDYAGHIGDEPVGIVMMDHPTNPRHPTYWHSRGYGLHAINPFGVSDFLNDKTQNGGLVLAPGEHVRFRYRVVIHPGLSPERLAALYTTWAGTTGSSSRD